MGPGCFSCKPNILDGTKEYTGDPVTTRTSQYPWAGKITAAHLKSTLSVCFKGSLNTRRAIIIYLVTSTLQVVRIPFPHPT